MDGVAGDGVGDAHVEASRIALVAVLAHEPQHDVVVVALEDLPDAAVEPLRASVQVVAPVVGAELHHRAVQGEAGTRDAVGVAPDDRSEVVRGVQVVLGARMAQHHVAAYAVTAGHGQRVHDRAEVEHLEHDARLAAQRDDPDRTEVALTERGRVHGYLALTTSITNHRVALPLMSAPLPSASYANAGGIWSSTRLPTLTPARPICHPGMKPVSACVAGPRL